MKKVIQEAETCKSCGRTEHSEIYEVYCDECEQLFEKGHEYGAKGVRYVVWDDSIEEFDDSHFERDFCSYQCMIKKLRTEDLSDGKRVTLEFYINESIIDQIFRAFIPNDERD